MKNVYNFLSFYVSFRLLAASWSSSLANGEKSKPNSCTVHHQHTCQHTHISLPLLFLFSFSFLFLFLVLTLVINGAVQ
ncbi:Uncharacterized protein APZ42_026422 [Daphnia magna]|uniref:Uncharacterized protein n=1 Tax=Daphnia magna TaxID=35525 RepID=A0A164S6J4_9CRUS|nr:Uncharacterized protein APZ42_026422 [Daphnia magna]